MNVEMPDGTMLSVPDGATKQEVMALYESQKPKAIASVPNEIEGADYAKGLTRAGLEGATLGFADEAGLGIAALPASLMTGEKYGDVYGKMRETYNQQQGEFERQNPKTALGANIAGGLMTGGIGGAKLLGSAKALANPMRSAAKLGAGTGAVAGAGYAPTMGDVPAYAATGAAAGGVIPPALMMGGRALAPIAGAAKSMFSTPSPTQTAGKVVGQYIKEDDQTANQLRQLMMEKGKQSVLADVGGANLQGMAQAAAQYSGKMKTDVGKMFSERQAGSFNRLMGSMKKMSGGDTKYFANMQNIMKKGLENSKPYYEAAEKQAVTVTDDLAELFNRPSMKAALSKGARKAADEGITIPKNVATGSNINFKTFDYAKRALDDKIGVAIRQGNGDDARILMNIKSQMLDVADNQIPDYKMARSIYSEGAGNVNAMELGRKILRDDFDEMAFMVDKMSKSEKDSFINGALKTVRDKLMTGKEDKNAATKLSSQLVRERLRTMFPDDDTYKSFIGQLDIEDDFARTYQKIYGGSQTQPRGVQDKELITRAHGGASIEGQDTLTVVGNVIKSVTGKRDMPVGVAEEIQRLVFTPVNQLTKKDWNLLRKNSINLKGLNELKTALSVAPGTAVTGAAMERSAR